MRKLKRRSLAGLGGLALGLFLGATPLQISWGNVGQFEYFDELVVLDGRPVKGLQVKSPIEGEDTSFDFSQGRLYVRLQILEKPSTLPLRLAFFLWQRQPDGLRHCGLGRYELPDLDSTGNYYFDLGDTQGWWHGKYDFPEWTEPFDKVAFVPWVGNSGQQLTAEDCGSHCYQGDDLENHTPVVYRATGIWVPHGEALVPPSDWDCPTAWPLQDTLSEKTTQAISSEQAGTEWLILDRVIVHAQAEGIDKTMGFSEFPLPKDIASDWVEPIPMKDGTLHCRLEVATKPTEMEIHYQLGFQWTGGCEGHLFKEKFPRNDIHPIKECGVYTWSQPIATFWEPECQADDPIDWHERMTRLLVVVWDGHPRIVDDRWGRGWPEMDLAQFYPMTVHFQAVVVAPGTEFGGWDSYQRLLYNMKESK